MLLLKIENLMVDFRARNGGSIRVLDDVSLSVESSQAHGVVGESGSGKTVMAYSILRLLPHTGSVMGGSIRWQGSDIINMSERDLRNVRGRGIAMVFQNAVGSLNPALKIGQQFHSLLRHRMGLSPRETDMEIANLLESVHLLDVNRISNSYPSELSGGMSQRVAIAMALACRPQLLIADEPTSSLDITIAAQVLELLADLKAEYDLSVLFISHDLAAVSRLCEYVTVIYGGRVLETGSIENVFDRPLHPYTQLLLDAVAVHTRGRHKEQSLRAVDSGPMAPVILSLRSPGCVYADRCIHAWEKCVRQAPALIEQGNDRKVACWLYK